MILDLVNIFGRDPQLAYFTGSDAESANWRCKAASSCARILPEGVETWCQVDEFAAPHDIYDFNNTLGFDHDLKTGPF